MNPRRRKRKRLGGKRRKVTISPKLPCELCYRFRCDGKHGNRASTQRRLDASKEGS